MNIIDINNQDFSAAWEALWNQDILQQSLYIRDNIDYQVEYCSDSTFKDISFAIISENEPVLSIRITLQEIGSTRELTAYGLPLLLVENFNLSNTKRDKANKLLREKVRNIVSDFGVDKITYRDFVIKDDLSALGCCLLDMGAKAVPYFTQLIDLRKPENELFKSTRKSYKSLINWGRKNLNIRIINADSISMDDIENFRQIHIREAGRETRSKKSWEIQFDMILKGKAFLVTAEDDCSLVSAAMFINSNKYCYYGVSASDRSMFDKPLSHAVIWSAILHAKNLGCCYFEMGEQLYFNQGNPAPSKKELGISKFKAGFGGETKVCLDITWENT